MTIHPTIRYDDAEAALAFLTGTLGLEEQFVARDDDGRVTHAELSHETGVVMIGPRADRPDPFDTGRAVVYLAADDIDARHDRAVEAGATVVHGPLDQPYGSREFAVSDPEGNVWSVGTYRPAVKP